MKKPSLLLSSVVVIMLLGFNPGVCGKACAKACSKSADNAASAGAKSGDNIVSDAAKSGDNLASDAARASDNITADAAKNADNTAAHAEGPYTYRDQQYQHFNEIPFEASETIYLDNALTSEQADHLMKRGVKFVYNWSAKSAQAGKRFKIIYLISDNIQAVKALYNLDDTYANRLINMSSEIMGDESISKAATFNEMLQQQKTALDNDEVPILVFHNNLSEEQISKLDSRTNYITCNSFSINPEAYLSSTTLLDMRGVLRGLVQAKGQSNLESFYKDFTGVYYDYMRQQHKKKTLIYVVGGAAVGGGAYAIAYYNQNDEI